MEIVDPFEEIKKAIKQAIGSEGHVTKIDFEGPEVVIYSKNPRVLTQGNGIVVELAKSLRKRIVVRPDPSVLVEQEKAIELVKKIVPEEAGIGEIKFDEVFNEIIIEANKPGLVIGKEGAMLNEIRAKVGWVPRVVRMPPISSTIVENIRILQFKKGDEIKDFLRKVGRRIHRPMLAKTQWVRLSLLGGFREVGRSGLYLHTPESKVLIDCGVNVAASEPEQMYPYLGVPEFKLQELDGVIISHAHLDHSGFLPYLFFMGYEGPVYCTPPTRDLMYLLQWDYLDVLEREGKSLPYTRNDVKKVVRHTIALDYNEITDIAPDVRLTLHNAGHILGSSITHLHIKEGVYNLAYTGDMKFSHSRLFEPANTVFPRLETLIMESTYGGNNDVQQSRAKAEEDVINKINETISRGGKVLIPVFAVGRAQELLLVLEAYRREGKMVDIPVHLDGMIWEATGIHTTYPIYLNKIIQGQILHKGENPFLNDMFRRVSGNVKRQEIMDGEPSVILATSGMLAGGPAIEYFKHFAEDAKNTLIFVGYQAEGSLGRRIQKGWKEIPMKEEGGKTKTVNSNMEIFTLDGFSGHSDRNQLINYVKRLSQKPERIITAHGEGIKCADLASTLHKLLKVETKSPQNLEVLRIK